MKLNEALIPHYICSIIPIYKLKNKVMLKEEYLREKPTWYEIDDKLKYFKVRNDFRLFTEQFFSKFGKEVLGLDTLDYNVAVVRTSSPDDINGGEKKVGLLSDNFQSKNKNYYLLSEMFDSEISNLKSYGYSLDAVINFLNDTISKEDLLKCKDFLIRLFIADSFTMQLDRNPNNIGFEIPKVDGIGYKKRLRPEAIEMVADSNKLLVTENGFSKLKGLTPSKVYDNERILGVDHKKVFLYNHGDVWTPVWPYSENLLFESQEQAKKVQEEEYDGCDPNLIELILNNPEYMPLIDRLANGDEYRKILEEFTSGETQVHLMPESIEYFELLMEDRRKEFQKVLKI